MRFIGRLPGDFCHFGLETSRFKSFRNRVERFRSAGHLNGAVFVRNHVFGTRIKRDFHHLIFCRYTGSKEEITNMVEHKGYGTFRAEIAAMIYSRKHHIYFHALPF